MTVAEPVRQDADLGPDEAEGEVDGARPMIEDVILEEDETDDGVEITDVPENRNDE